MSDRTARNLFQNGTSCPIEWLFPKWKKPKTRLKTTRPKSGDPCAARTKLKAVRIVAGLSQSALAKKSGINIRTLQAYEQGRKSFDNAHLETIIKVATACGCRLEHLIESPEILDLLKNYKNLL